MCVTLKKFTNDCSVGTLNNNINHVICLNNIINDCANNLIFWLTYYINRCTVYVPNQFSHCWYFLCTGRSVWECVNTKQYVSFMVRSVTPCLSLIALPQNQKYVYI